MQYQSMLNDAINKIEACHEANLLDELEAMLLADETIATEGKKKAAEIIGHILGAFDQPVLEPQNILNFAALTLQYATLAESGVVFPLFINQQRENLRVMYIDNELFLLQGIDTIEAIDDEMMRELYAHSRQADGFPVIPAAHLLHFIALYQEIEDISIAISDFCFALNSEVFCSDFSLQEVHFVGHGIPKETRAMLESIWRSQRLDSVSYNAIIKGLK